LQKQVHEAKAINLPNLVMQPQQTIESQQFSTHGEWCGPNVPRKGHNPKPIDELDRACRRHDKAYERGFVRGADAQFVRDTAKIPTVAAQLHRAAFVAKQAAGLSKDHSTEVVMYKPPARDLVGVELNPGPKGKMVGPVISAKAYGALLKGMQHKKTKPKRGRKQKKSGRTNAQLTFNKINNTGVRGTSSAVIPFDEFITSVNGSTGTNLDFNTAFLVNPGQALTFPLLSKEAVLWERWEAVEDFQVYYKRIVSEYNSNGSAGKVVLAYLADPKAPPPADIQHVESTDVHADGMPCENITLRIPKEIINNGKIKFVRPGNLPGSSAITDYDGGKFYSCTYGNNATTSIGELRIKGKVRFKDRIDESTTVPPILFSTTSFFDNTPGSITSSTVSPLQLASSNVNALNVVNTAGSMVLPLGSYIIRAWCVLIATTTPLTSDELYINYNNALASVASKRTMLAAAGIYTDTLFTEAFIQSNGVDATVINLYAVFANTCTSQGQVTIQAI
jgi:hypothetical protein